MRNGASAGQTDAVVVGSGVAGLGAALELARAGKRVVILESAATPGGASVVSGGGSCIVGTALQREHGVVDDVELAFEDWRRWGGDRVDTPWARRYLENSEEAIFRFCEGLGVSWAQLSAHEGNSVPRHHVPAGGGRAVVEALLQALPGERVSLRCGVRVVELVRRSGGVGGVVCESDGVRERIDAPITVVCAGGFVNNPRMLGEHVTRLGRVERWLCGGSDGAVGSGHELLSELGVRFTDLDKAWVYPLGSPNPRDATGSRGVLIRGITSDVWVNRGGRRFHDERLRGGVSGTDALLAQPGQTAWGIFDAREAQRLLLYDDEYYGRYDLPRFGPSFRAERDRVEEFWATSEFAWRADSPEALADVLGIPPTELMAALGEYNAEVESAAATADAVRRAPIVEPPFHAIRYMPLIQKNLGGVVTDLDCRVEGGDGKLIGGLFAAGEVAGMAGGHINGSAALEGTMFGPSLYSGRVAGRAALSVPTAR